MSAGVDSEPFADAPEQGPIRLALIAALDPVDLMKELQRLVRRPASPVPHEQLGTMLRKDLDDEESDLIVLTAEEDRVVDRLLIGLPQDLRFEHLDRNPSTRVRDAVYNLIRDAFADREVDAVDRFIEEHAREPEERVCYVPIENLRVAKRRDVLDLRLLPIDHEDVPAAHAFWNPAPPVAAIAAVPVVGTHLGKMARRAQDRVERVLRVLRVAMREHRGVPNEQLRFRIGDFYTFGPTLAGFQTRPDVSWEVDLDDEFASLVTGQPIARLVDPPQSDIDRRAELALRWLEDAALEGDQMKRLLFVFFALESLFGSRSERLKGHRIAFRRAVLSATMEGRFSHPNRMFDLYQSVRSEAVHGESRIDVCDKDVTQFAWDARIALNEFLAFADREGLSKRKEVRKALDGSPEADQLCEWIQQYAGPSWAVLLEERESVSKGSAGPADIPRNGQEPAT